MTSTKCSKSRVLFGPVLVFSLKTFKRKTRELVGAAGKEYHPPKISMQERMSFMITAFKVGKNMLALEDSLFFQKRLCVFLRKLKKSKHVR